MSAVIDWFIKHNPPSISPNTTLHLLEIAKRLREEMAKDPETPKTIELYAIALETIAKISHVQQGVVIVELQRALARDKK